MEQSTHEILDLETFDDEEDDEDLDWVESSDVDDLLDDDFEEELD